MTAIVLPNIDRSTLEDLKERMPSLRLSDIELPSMEHAGRQADQTIDRLLGRSRFPVWPWIAAGIAIAAIVGTAAALLSWNRRPWSSWQSRVGSGRPGGSNGVGSAADAGIGVTSAYGEGSIIGTTDTGIGEAGYGTNAGISSLEEPLP
jgi:hypothetical protein